MSLEVSFGKPFPVSLLCAVVQELRTQLPTVAVIPAACCNASLL